MKIVIATAVYYPMINGVAVFSYNLARGLAKRGHQVMVLCPSQTKRSYTRTTNGVKTVYLRSVEAKIYPDQIHATGATKTWRGHTLPRLFYRHGFKIAMFPERAVRRALTQFQPDVVHIQVSDLIGLSTLVYARRHQIPVVATEHNQPEVLTDPLGVPRLIKKPLESILAAYFARRSRHSDFFTMPTEEAIKNLLYKHGHKIKIPVAAVSNGVNLSNFQPGKPPKSFYQKYGLPTDAPIVLYVGRVDPEKKVNLLIEAFEQVVTKEGDKVPHLVIAGDGVALASLKKQARKSQVGSRIHFLGRVTPPDLYQLYQTGTVFATMSEIETQGIVLIEAAATGLPLIVVDRGAVSEICHDGENGCLCPAGDTTAVAGKIRQLLEQPALRARFAKRSRELAFQHDFERTLDQFMNIYHKVQEKVPGRHPK